MFAKVSRVGALFGRRGAGQLFMTWLKCSMDF